VGKHAVNEKPQADHAADECNEDDKDSSTASSSNDGDDANQSEEDYKGRKIIGNQRRFFSNRAETTTFPNFEPHHQTYSTDSVGM